MGLLQTIQGIIDDKLMNIGLMKVKNIRSVGRSQMNIEHDSGSYIRFKPDGTIDTNGLSGLGGDVSNPMTEDLSTSGYKIKNTSGAVTFESSTGVFIFQISS
jgi:hypothetical protein